MRGKGARVPQAAVRRCSAVSGRPRFSVAHSRFSALACFMMLAPVLMLTSACRTSGPPSHTPSPRSPVEAPPSSDSSDIVAGASIDDMPLPEGDFSFEGGDGSSLEQAVIVKAPDESIGVAAVYGWIGRHYPGSKAAGQNTVIKNGKFYDVIDVVTGTQERRTFYFDITQFFGKF